MEKQFQEILSMFQVKIRIEDFNLFIWLLIKLKISFIIVKNKKKRK
jgi:hypothetical protein